MWCFRDALAQALGWTEGGADYQSVPPNISYKDALKMCERHRLTVYRYVYANGRSLFLVRDRRGEQFPVGDYPLDKVKEQALC